MDTRICDAIHNRYVLKFTYNGFPRIVEPCAYGLGRPKKEEELFCCQTGGASERGGIPKWRRFKVSEIESLKVTQEHFANVRCGNPKFEKGMSTIFCEL